MTYIIGAKTLDGIVMVSDRRIILSDTEYKEGNKIFNPIKDVVIGCAGFKGIIDDLKEETTKRLNMSQTTLEKIITIESIIKELNERYKPRLSEIFPKNFPENKIKLIECLVVISEKPKTRLFKIFSIGYHEEISGNNYCAIGSGKPYGAVFLKRTYEYLWDSYEIHKEKIIEKTSDTETTSHLKPDMIEVSSLLTFSVIMVQALKVNISVGGGAEVWFSPDGKDPRTPSKEEREKIKETTSAMLSFVDLGQWYRKGKQQTELDI